MLGTTQEYFDEMEKLKQYEALGTVEELSTRVREEDILKFYYCESLNKYLVGQRLDTMYYAETAQGLENGAMIGTVTEGGEVFAWWIPALAGLNTVVVATTLFVLIPKRDEF